MRGRVHGVHYFIRVYALGFQNVGVGRLNNSVTELREFLIRKCIGVLQGQKKWPLKRGFVVMDSSLSMIAS